MERHLFTRERRKWRTEVRNGIWETENGRDGIMEVDEKDGSGDERRWWRGLRWLGFTCGVPLFLPCSPPFMGFRSWSHELALYPINQMTYVPTMQVKYHRKRRKIGQKMHLWSIMLIASNSTYETNINLTIYIIYQGQWLYIVNSLKR